MKEFLGQYGKIILISLSVVFILTFLLSTGSNSFRGKMPEGKSTYDKVDSSSTVGDISKRKPPEILVQDGKMKARQTYNFRDARFVKVKNEDGTEANVTLSVTKVLKPGGYLVANPEANFKAAKGTYTVTYKAVEVYNTSKRTSTKTTTFLCD